MIVKCPHCSILIYIEQINCGIFRCGILCDTFEQIPPHSPKEICDELFLNNKIFGCGKPFKVEIIETELIAIICDYI